MLPQKVDTILRSITQLHPMPSNVTRILKEIENPDISISTVAGLVGLDQALAALVLQASNSASLGYARSCSSIHEAVMHIGLRRLKSTLLTCTATGMLSRRLQGYRLGDGDLWAHSLTTAVASEWLAKALGYPEPEEAYVSGLLHDVGKLLLDQFVLSDYSKIADFMRVYQMRLWQVEEKLIGIDHARVGGLIAERWDFPVILVDAIRFHHYPSFARSNQKLPAIVNLANAFAVQYSVGNPELFSNEIHPESLNILRISQDEVDRLNEKMAGYLMNSQTIRQGVK